MESTLFRFIDAGEFFISFIWLPLLIWTILSSAVWMVVRSSERIHPQYHYHTRLALIMALPAGFLFLMILDLLTGILFSSVSAESTLKIVSVTSPIEIGFIPAEEGTAISPLYITYAAVFILFIVGLVLSWSRYAIQWIQLYKLKKNCSFFPLLQMKELADSNRTFAISTGKKVHVTFLTADIIPVTFGFRKPVILLPGSLQNNPKKLNLAIRHELTHISQHDFFTHLMVLIVETMFWFHPLVHLFKKELVEYREMRCDNMVLTEKSVSRKEYAMLLLELIPMPNINKELSVNMAQESSNLKKRISMITSQNANKPIPKRTSAVLLGTLLLSTAIAMACTDMQTYTVFDEEELDLMTDVDRSGDRGYHQIIIFMKEEEQAERHESKLAQLQMLQPEHIQSIEILKDDAAVEQYGSRGEKGVILVKTNLDQESYNTTLKALGMEAETIQPAPEPMEGDDPEDYFVVVEDMPELIGGLAQLQREIRYPEMARRAGIEGRVYIQFIINEQGDVERPRVIRGIGGGADDEALRVVSQAKFRPGMQRGRPVRVQYSLPIFFRLQGSESTPEQAGFEPEGESLSEMTVSGYGSRESDTGTRIEAEVIHNQMEIDIEKRGDTIRGKVTDRSSGEPLVGANVILPGANRGTATDQNGNFIMESLDSNTEELTISFVGYQTARVVF